MQGENPLFSLGLRGNENNFTNLTSGNLTSPIASRLSQFEKNDNLIDETGSVISNEYDYDYFQQLLSSNSIISTSPVNSWLENDTDAGLEDFNDWTVDHGFVEGSHLWVLLVIGYSFVFVVGVFGNIFLLAALCAGTGGRSRALPVRNHILLNLAAADLAVTGICVPISACAAANYSCWPSFFVSYMCQFGPLLQRTPVAASTLTLALLSLDRWANLRHPRMSQRLREKHYVFISIASIWLLAGLVAFPTFLSRKWVQDEITIVDDTGYSSDDNHVEDNWGTCVERWTSAGLLYVYKGTYLGTAFISPALIVAACHASVSKKLTSQLLDAGGKNGRGGGESDLGKLKQKPKQVLIVPQEPTNNVNKNGLIEIDKPLQLQTMQRKMVLCDPNSDEDDVYLRMQIQADLESFRISSKYHQQQHQIGNNGKLSRNLMKRDSVGSLSPPTATTNGKSNHKTGTLKAAKRETSIIRAHRRLRKKLLAKDKTTRTSIAIMIKPPPLLPTYSSQSFRSRKRAANLLAALAAVFVFCWVPYVLCALWEIFSPGKSLVRLLIPFSLFLGHLHSAINPVVSWRLNRSAFVRFQKLQFLSFIPLWNPFKCFTCPCDITEDNDNQDNNPGDAAAGRDSSDGSRHGRGRNCCPCTFFQSTSTTTPEIWNRNSSTNDQALGAFHPRYLNRLAPKPISRCHTSAYFNN